MTLKEVADLLSARVLQGSQDELGVTVSKAAASDLMSDILARLVSADLMLTGLTTTQTIRTASVAGINCVVICRGKVVPESITELAKEEGIVLMVCDLTLFEACGLLYEKGLRGVSGRVKG
jgi:predicted transcriptional regulator